MRVILKLFLALCLGFAANAGWADDGIEVGEAEFTFASDLADDGIEVGEAEFTFASDLAEQGFEPFAVSDAVKASFGMKKGADMYMCFTAYNPVRSEKRTKIIAGAIEGGMNGRTVPNIRVVCVLIQ